MGLLIKCAFYTYSRGTGGADVTQGIWYIMKNASLDTEIDLNPISATYQLIHLKKVC